MTIGTPRLHQQNVELFAKLNQEMKSIQSQVGSGKADLKLSENLHEIAKLSAAEEKILETNQFMENSKRAKTELEFLDVALDRLQNLTVSLQELAVESANDTFSKKERENLGGKARKHVALARVDDHRLSLHHHTKPRAHDPDEGRRKNWHHLAQSGRRCRRSASGGERKP